MSLGKPRPPEGRGRPSALAGPDEATPAHGPDEQNGGQEPDSSQSVGQFAASKPLAIRGSDNKEQDATTSPTSSRSRGKERKVLSGLTIL